MKIAHSLPDPKPRKSGIWLIWSCAGEFIRSLCSGDKEVALQHPYSCLGGHVKISEFPVKSDF